MDLTNLPPNKQPRRGQKFDFGRMILGNYVPPQARDLEEAILGVMMLVPAAILEVKAILAPEDFYVTSNQLICRTIFELSDQNQIPDILLVTERLREKELLEECNGVYYVVKLTNGVVSDANVKTYSYIVKEKSLARRLILLSGSIIDRVFGNEDLFETMYAVENELKGINTEIEKTRVTKVEHIAMRVIQRLETRMQNARNKVQDPNDVYTGFPEWDRINGPMFPGLYVIAGRPGMGKGVMLTEGVCRMAVRHPVGVINGEMTDEQFIVRMICNLLAIDNELWKKPGEFITDDDMRKVYESVQEVINLNLHIHNGTDIHEIANKIRLWVDQFGVKAIWADFLGLFKVPDEIGRYMTDTEKLNYIMEVLRSLAKDLNIPIILFCQLNRELYKRGSKEPNLADLKGSGKIEEFAYQISFLHRPEYYDPTAITDELGESTLGLCYQIIAKHRDGRLARLKHKFIPQFSQLKEWDQSLTTGWQPTATTPF